MALPVDARAEDFAIGSALDTGAPLVLANLLELPPYPATLMLLGPGAATLPHEEALDEVRATAARAAAPRPRCRAPGPAPRAVPRLGGAGRVIAVDSGRRLRYETRGAFLNEL